MRIRCLITMLCLAAFAANARVISYAPYTDRVATPGLQHRMNRHFVLIEQTPGGSPGMLLPIPPIGIYQPGQVVLYDAKGQEEPRVVFPQDGSSASINVAAVREDDRQVPTILLQTNANFKSANPTALAIWLLSTDGGTTWVKVSLPTTAMYIPSAADTGGPFVRARYSNVRIGTRDFPFVVAINNSVYSVASDGSTRLLFTASKTTLVGSDLEGRRFVVLTSDQIVMVDVNGVTKQITPASVTGSIEGWIAPDGGVFWEQSMSQGQVVLFYAAHGIVSPVAASWDGSPLAQPPINSSWVFFAVPTADYSGAWIIKRGGGRPTQLLRYTPGGDLVGQWTDVSAPEVEALHAGTSGQTLLIQVHRPRQSVDQMMFKDPALAVWRVGTPAPRSYDELFLNEGTTKGFVHVDVDRIGSGDPFVFDSGTQSAGIPVPVASPDPSGGGSDVVQEWGVVRASLAQRLALPGIGRIPGAYGSNWVSDVTFYNPADTAVSFDLSFVPNGVDPRTLELPRHDRLTLTAREIRVIPDIIKNFYNADVANGTLFVSPDIGSAINVTSRTYTRSSSGTYGYSMNGIDFFAASSSRFPVTFSGAFQGTNFRTNLILTDVSGRGTNAVLSAAGPNGPTGTDVQDFSAPPLGQQQFNGVGPLLSLGSSETGALVVQPNRGETIASLFVIDNRTNDPTFFPPDIPASVMRTIPAIGHLDGANGSKFRSDLYLFNNSSQPKTVNLQAKLWDVPENPSTLPLTLLPHEARVIRDVLYNAFGKTGIARLRFTAQGSTTDTSVRVTSRTYTIDANGGTYGFLMPPLNSFQSGGAGDTLEILGASLDGRLRTNLGLVDLAAFPGVRAPRARIDIINDHGQSIDSFEITVPSAGGMQINDLFHGRLLPEGPTPVLLRVTTIEGMIGAYAAFVDNGTNDPTYAAANLAAK